MTATTAYPPTTRCEQLLVKWRTPAEEADGMARIAEALIWQRRAAARDICLAVPNRAWATSLQQACARHEVPAALLLPCTRPGLRARTALALLKFLANPADEAQRRLLREAGMDDSRMGAFADAHAQSRARALSRALDLAGIPEFEGVLQHVCGDEDAAALHALACEQMARPTLAADAQAVSIAHYRAVQGSFAYVALLGCVDGLVPEPAAFEAQDAAEREQAAGRCREAFERTLGMARTLGIASSFTRLDASAADALHVQYTRRKRENGQALAMCRPTCFLAEAGMQRPSTMGGQALLRSYGLN